MIPVGSATTDSHLSRSLRRPIDQVASLILGVFAFAAAWGSACGRPPRTPHGPDPAAALRLEVVPQRGEQVVGKPIYLLLRLVNRTPDTLRVAWFNTAYAAFQVVVRGEGRAYPVGGVIVDVVCARPCDGRAPLAPGDTAYDVKLVDPRPWNWETRQRLAGPEPGVYTVDVTYVSRLGGVGGLVHASSPPIRLVAPPDPPPETLARYQALLRAIDDRTTRGSAFAEDALQWSRDRLAADSSDPGVAYLLTWANAMASVRGPVPDSVPRAVRTLLCDLAAIQRELPSGAAAALWCAGGKHRDLATLREELGTSLARRVLDFQTWLVARSW